MQTCDSQLSPAERSFGLMVMRRERGRERERGRHRQSFICMSLICLYCNTGKKAYTYNLTIFTYSMCSCVCEFQSATEAVKIQSAARGHQGRQKAAALAAARREQVSNGLWGDGFWIQGIQGIGFSPWWHDMSCHTKWKTQLLCWIANDVQISFDVMTCVNARKFDTCHVDTVYSDCFRVSTGWSIV